MNPLARAIARSRAPSPDPWEETSRRLAEKGMTPGRALTYWQRGQKSPGPVRAVLLCVHLRPETLSPTLRGHSLVGRLWDWHEVFDVSLVLDEEGLPRVIATSALLSGFWS